MSNHEMTSKLDPLGESSARTLEDEGSGVEEVEVESPPLEIQQSTQPEEHLKLIQGSTQNAKTPTISATASTSSSRHPHPPHPPSRDKLYIPIIISKCEEGSSECHPSASQNSRISSPLIPVDHQLTVTSLKSLGLIDPETRDDDGGGTLCTLPAWNAFALSDPSAQLTVKSITSVGLGSTDGRNLYVRRVPSTASVLIGNNSLAAVRRRDTEDDDDDEMSDYGSSTYSEESPFRFRRKHWRNKFEFILACIGFTVGLGNWWRFPYLCYKSGGGAFLVPYFIMLFICAIPLLYMELAIGQFTRRGPLKALEKICPLFKGTGLASLIISFIMSTYSIVIIAWTLYYLVASFNAELPWRGCSNPWNSENCWNIDSSRNQTFPHLNTTTTTIHINNASQFQELQENQREFNLSHSAKSTSTQEYFDRKVLQRSSGIDEPGYLRNELVLCLFAGWILVYFSLWKSVRSFGRVLYLTAIFPYLLIIAFISFTLTLPGAYTGLQYFFRPQWDLLLDAKVWVNAAAQNFNSIGVAMGSIITFSSYNKFSNNILTDTVAIAFTNAFTSVLVGLIVFSMLGNIAMEQGTTIDDVVADGPGLIFVIYPQVLIKTPLPHLWSVLFFSMLLCVALDNEFAMVEVVITSIRDGFPKFIEKYLKCHELLVLVICSISFIIGLPFLLQGGIYAFQLVDQFTAAYSLMYLAFFEVIAVVWIYGTDRLSNNIQEMTGKRPSAYFITCWKYLAPLLLIAVWVLSFVDYEKPTYDNGKIQYPKWSEGIGWIISSTSLICIPVVAVLQLRKSAGSTISEKFKSSIKSTIYECPICKCTRCSHDADESSEWHLRRRSSIKATKMIPILMTENVYEKVSSL